MRKLYSFLIIVIFGTITIYASDKSLRHPKEGHLTNIKQLTFGGENAEAYFSFDGKKLIFQSTRNGYGYKADQIYIMNTDGSNMKMVSTGRGRCTCSYFFPDGKILFSSTHHYDTEPPPPPDRSRGYVWPIYPSYDIFVADEDGSNLKQLTYSWGYDAEATVSPTGNRIVFTSMRDGDLDIYTMKIDGSDVRRLTETLGYDGGAFFSPDGKKIVFRAYHPQTPQEIVEYKRLLVKHLIRPSRFELFVMSSNGKSIKQITNNRAINFCPYFTPYGKRIIFASNMHDPKRHNFDLYLIKIDGTDLERVTYHEEFDAFPMFSPDGKKLVWASNRNSKVKGETNIFIADWVE